MKPDYVDVSRGYCNRQTGIQNPPCFGLVHCVDVSHRHCSLGARVCWCFIQVLYSSYLEARVGWCFKRLLCPPSGHLKPALFWGQFTGLMFQAGTVLFLPWCQGMLTASLRGVLVLRFHVGCPAISGPRICSSRFSILSLFHRAWNDCTGGLDRSTDIQTPS